jgi:hypothetical protein
MLHDGSNHYKLPHMSKQKLRNMNAMPTSVPCSEEAYRKDMDLASKYFFFTV